MLGKVRITVEHEKKSKIKCTIQFVDDTTDDSSSESNEPEMGDDEKVKRMIY